MSVVTATCLCQAQAGRGLLWEGHGARAEGNLQWLLQERRQEGPPGGLPDPHRPAGGLHPPLQCLVQPTTRVVRIAFLPRRSLSNFA